MASSLEVSPDALEKALLPTPPGATDAEGGTLARALAAGRFRLQFQPQVDMTDGRVIGVEALLRWREPGRGEVPPAEFIPVAESSGFIVELGRWVLDRALAQAAEWNRSGLELPMAVNVSALELREACFAEEVARALARHAVAPQQLELELTESRALEEDPVVRANLESLSAQGVRLAVDDFGSGYCGLLLLRRFPMQRLKLDRSFVQNLLHSHTDAELLQAALRIAQAVGAELLVEGVETTDQRDALRAAGCRAAQGYLYSRPLEPGQVPEYVARARARASHAAARQVRLPLHARPAGQPALWAHAA
jgi:EAL domain-containing protein (putative c-di-GMP-specific phosphodiesterase class I)